MPKIVVDTTRKEIICYRIIAYINNCGMLKMIVAKTRK
jgi:hypothetical protein